MKRGKQKRYVLQLFSDVTDGPVTELALADNDGMILRMRLESDGVLLGPDVDVAVTRRVFRADELAQSRTLESAYETVEDRAAKLHALASTGRFAVRPGRHFSEAQIDEIAREIGKRIGRWAARS